MRIAVDTNVLARYLAWDDERQAKAAATIIESAEVLVISIVVLCELVWVLKRAYGYSKEDILGAVRGIVESRNVDVDRAAAEAGLRMLAAGSDFADGVIQIDAVRAKCHRLVTFDRDFASRAASMDIQLLGPAS